MIIISSSIAEEWDTGRLFFFFEEQEKNWKLLFVGGKKFDFCRGKTIYHVVKVHTIRVDTVRGPSWAVEYHRVQSRRGVVKSFCTLISCGTLHDAVDVYRQKRQDVWPLH